MNGERKTSKENTLTKGKNTINTGKHELSAPEKKGMKNDERDENPPVEIIYGRLKRLRTDEIDGRNRLKLREEKGWEGRKTKATSKGKSTNILKRKHWLKSLRKESKGFA